MAGPGGRSAPRGDPDRLLRLLRARLTWGPGSERDIVILVEGSDDPFESRAAGWDTTRLPAPADVLVYTREEWGRLSPTSAFHRMVMREAVWVYGKDVDKGTRPG